jgi:predicted transcriptional regulator of viral defense system
MNMIDANLVAVVDSLRVKHLLGEVSDKRGKIARMIHSGQLIQLRRGLYATRRDINPLCFAASLYGPSYVSFETALAYYGVIPEAVYEIMSATLKRGKDFETPFGRYHFQAIPESVYAIGIERVIESGFPFLIASPTKALCDCIARESGMRSMLDVRHWSELMRLDGELELDLEIIRACAERYGRPAVRCLQRTVEKYGGIMP